MKKLKEFLRKNPEVIICEFCFLIYVASVIYYYVSLPYVFTFMEFSFVFCFCIAVIFIPISILFLIFLYRYNKLVFLVFYYLAISFSCTPLAFLYWVSGPYPIGNLIYGIVNLGVLPVISQPGAARPLIEFVLAFILFHTTLEAIIRNSIKRSFAKKVFEQPNN